MIVLAALASMLPATRKPAPGSPREPEPEREPLPWLAGYRIAHSGEFVAADEASPCVPARTRVALRVGGQFVGAVLLETSENGGGTWRPLQRDGRPLLLAAPGAVCAACMLVGDVPPFARARCLSLAAGAVRWSLSTW